MYKPEYAKGMICVYFHDDPSAEFISGFMGGLGYSYEIDSFNLNSYIVHLKENQTEDEAIALFKEFSNYIDSAQKIDLKEEKRATSIDGIISRSNELLSEYSGLPTEEYNTKLDELSDYILSLKEQD